jgi:hypothetical protein
VVVVLVMILASGPNPKLVPEKTIDFEIGTELGFLKIEFLRILLLHKREP